MFQALFKQLFFHFLSLSFVHSLSFYQYFSLLLYHRPLMPAIATAVGRLSSRGRLKIERDRTTEADRDSALLIEEEIESWIVCGSTSCLANWSHASLCLNSSIRGLICLI